MAGDTFEMSCTNLKSCCEYHAAKLPNGCKEGRLCPARSQASKETTMAHVITSKQSHERTPRMASDAQFHWAGGAEDYPMNPTKTDRWGIAMIVVAVAGSAAVIIKSILG